MDECHKLLTNKVDLGNLEGHQILPNIYEPLPLGGPPGDKERKIALSISKLKAARYLDFGLEELVPSLWVESEREYDISAIADANSQCDQCQGVRKIRYNYLREIILRRADYQEYKISEKDFKNLHPNDFEDLSFSINQDKLTIPSPEQTRSVFTKHQAQHVDKKPVNRNRLGDLTARIESYQTKINLNSNWDAVRLLLQRRLNKTSLIQEQLSIRQKSSKEKLIGG
ncbi:hypothetical protein Tco_0194151 [Tanacetum coccineum]